MPLIRVDELLDAESRSKARNTGILLDAQLVNYTPVMLGDYDTYHFRERLGGGYEPVAGLYAQAIRGKARWLARVVLASLHGCSFNSYYEVETQCARVLLSLGDSKRKEEVHVGLIELLFGTLSSTQLSSPFILSVKVERLSAKGWRSRYGRNALNRYGKLLTMGRGSSKKEKLRPHEQGSIGLRLEIREAPYASRLLDAARLGDTPLSDLYWRLAAFYAGMVITAPFLLGLGKASTRGFGRFKAEVYRIHDGLKSGSKLKELVDNLSSLYNVKNSDEATRLLHELLNMLIKLAEDATGMQRDKPGIGMIPRLINAIKPPSEIRHVRATVVKTRASDPVDALEFIAAAVLKQTWKQYSKISGVNYHTWPLGLPRGSDIPCTCADSTHHKPRHESGLKQRYGYIVLDTRIKSMYGLGQNDCMANSACIEETRETRQGKNKQIGVDALVEARIDLAVKVGNSVVTRRSNAKVKDIRHLSMIHLFPLPGTMNGTQGTLVVVLPFMSFSLNLGLDNKVPHIEGYKLFHIGGHFIIESGRPKPCCNAHVVDVGYVMSNVNVPPPSASSLKGSCSCDSDPGGIVWPNGLPQEGGYLDALMAAYEWVVHCLQRLRVGKKGLRLY